MSLHEGRPAGRPYLLDGARCCEHLLGASTDADVFGEVLPTHGTGGIYEELSRAGDVVSFRASSNVQEMVASSHFGVDVGKNGKSVASLFAEVARCIRRINTDGDGLNAGRLELA